jgi:hypothetical protein
VTPRDALEIANAAGRTGQFYVVCDHASRKHNVTRKDIASGLATATRVSHQADNDRWRIEGGHDLDGDGLTVIVAFEDGVIVVTAY